MKAFGPSNTRSPLVYASASAGVSHIAPDDHSCRTLKQYQGIQQGGHMPDKYTTDLAVTHVALDTVTMPATPSDYQKAERWR